MFWAKLAGDAEKQSGLQIYLKIQGALWIYLVLPDRIELSTSPLPRECSTTELRQQASIENRPDKAVRGGRSLPQGPRRASHDRPVDVKNDRSGSRQVAPPPVRSCPRHHDQMNYRQFPLAGVGLFYLEGRLRRETGNCDDDRRG